MKVAIVARTQMGQGVCIGAMEAYSGRAVRLLPPGQPCHTPDVPYQVGEFWEVEANPRMILEAPHVEDHDEHGPRKVGCCRDLAAGIRKFHKPWDGEPESLFDGVLHWRKSGTGYVARTRPPKSSVGFWTPARPLVLTMVEGRPHYLMIGHHSHFKLPLVGTLEPLDLIPAQTLLRVSLARWWVNPQAPSEGETCSLQLSGWIGAIAPQPRPAGMPSLDDLPF